MISPSHRRQPPLGNLIEQRIQPKYTPPYFPSMTRWSLAKFFVQNDVIHISLYLDQATASISPCALLYNSNLFARAVCRSMMAWSSFNSDDKRLVCIRILNSMTLVKFSQPRSNFTQAYSTNKDREGIHYWLCINTFFLCTYFVIKTINRRSSSSSFLAVHVSSFSLFFLAHFTIL
jgi:hypothetical protein